MRGEHLFLCLRIYLTHSTNQYPPDRAQVFSTFFGVFFSKNKNLHNYLECVTNIKSTQALYCLFTMKTFCSALTLALSTTLAAASPGSVLEDRALTCTPACPSNAVCIAGTTPRCVVPAGWVLLRLHVALP